MPEQTQLDEKIAELLALEKIERTDTQSKDIIALLERLRKRTEKAEARVKELSTDQARAAIVLSFNPLHHDTPSVEFHAARVVKERDDAREEVIRLREYKEEYDDMCAEHRRTMEETCEGSAATQEVHCTCVPQLERAIKSLRGQVVAKDKQIAELLANHASINTILDRLEPKIERTGQQSKDIIALLEWSRKRTEKAEARVKELEAVLKTYDDTAREICEHVDTDYCAKHGTDDKHCMAMACEVDSITRKRLNERKNDEL